MEQQPQTPQPIEGEQEQRFKTLGVRIQDELHTQLAFIAQLSGTTIADQIRVSIEARVLAAQDDPELIARAEELRAEIEREAAARRQAIAGLFGKAAVSGEAGTPRGRK
jgi:hypothetical protein